MTKFCFLGRRGAKGWIQKVQRNANLIFYFSFFLCIILSTRIHVLYFMFNLGSFLLKDACKSDRSRQELSKSLFQREFGCEIWLTRYRGFYIQYNILVVSYLETSDYWKNQVRRILVARGCLGFFSF